MFMSDSARNKAADKLTAALVDGNSAIAKDFTVYRLDEMNAADKLAMTEEHLISPDMAEKTGGRVLVSSDKTMSIMLMEEDHIRLQIIKSGYELESAYETADKVDDVIEENVEYAFDKDFGYLTSCPTNAGTGLRASVMLHLPALVITNNIQRVLNSAADLGIAVRGLYGEGSRASGDLYQLSNRITMGESEKDIISKLKGVTDRIIELEKQARESLMKDSREALEDRLWRSYGTLKYARIMSSDEAKQLMSDVILGINMGIIESDADIMELMTKSEPGQLIKAAGRSLDATERDTARAAMIREKI
jgi:protein arginine kinase